MAEPEVKAESFVCRELKSMHIWIKISNFFCRMPKAHILVIVTALQSDKNSDSSSNSAARRRKIKFVMNDLTGTL